MISWYAFGYLYLYGWEASTFPKNSVRNAERKVSGNFSIYQIKNYKIFWLAFGVTLPCQLEDCFPYHLFDHCLAGLWFLTSVYCISVCASLCQTCETNFDLKAFWVSAADNQIITLSNSSVYLSANIVLDKWSVWLTIRHSFSLLCSISVQ